ncbi:hypothetical protein CJP74_01600 [Psittacicella melopsittaci]|uniref:Glycosyl transferase family 25 domain-containing protein n=1 Tax=Psittacicella melopsittaci TaxID=2028576 RepID=A0A3A1YBV3_9GAMM|nr:glycosyltransferase family 25 protein [Psittacicella melopsittaci]RIY33587.1 hypothetical protein CJP74_01600 [Psittacicella melopsittaci]
MFKLARSYLLTNIQGHQTARRMSLRQPYAQELTEHKATTYTREQIAQRFDVQSYEAEFGKQNTSDQALNLILAHLDLHALIAQDKTLDEQDFVLVVQEGSILASNWKEQVQDILQAAQDNPVLSQRLEVVSLGDEQEPTFIPRDHQQLESKRKFKVSENNYLSVQACDNTVKRLRLLPSLNSYLEQRSPLNQAQTYKTRVFNFNGQPLKQNFAQDSFISLNQLNAPLELACVSRLPLVQPCAYLIKVKTLRTYIAGLKKKASKDGVWHEPIAWNMSMWHKICDYSVGSVAISNPSLAVANFINGNHVLDKSSHTIITWMQTHQIQAQTVSLGYDYVGQMPKFVLYSQNQAYSLQQFYGNSDCESFTPVPLISPADPRVQNLSMGWSRVFAELGKTSQIYREQSMGQTFALFSIFQAMLSNPQLGEMDYFILANSNLSLDIDWKARLNQVIASVANYLPNNLLILGDTVGAKNLNYQPASLYEQSGQLFDKGFKFIVQPDLEQLWDQNEFFSSSMQTIRQFTNSNFSFLIFNKQAIRTYINRLRQELQELSMDKILASWEKVANQIQLGLNVEVSELSKASLEQERDDPNSHYLFVGENLKIKDKELEKQNQNFYAQEQQRKIIAQITATSAQPEQDSLWLESLFKAYNHARLFNNKEQFRALIELDNLSDWQILTLAAPLFEANYTRLTQYLDFYSHAMLQVNPPLGFTSNLESVAQIANEEQFGLGDFQVLRTNRQQQRQQAFVNNNPQVTPDYLSKVRKFVISLPQSKDRLEAFMAQENCADFELFPAVYGKELSDEQVYARFDTQMFYHAYDRAMTPGEIGCTLSHWEIYQKVLQDPSIADDDWVLVCEDDSKFNPNWYQRLNSILHYLATHPERATTFVQCNNNALLQDRPLSLEELLEVTYFNLEAKNHVVLSKQQNLFFPHAVVSYGSSNYLFKKSLLKTQLFQSLTRPYWVADDFPRFFEFVPDSYAYASPMLSYQNVEEFTSVIEDERELAIKNKRQRLMSVPIYEPLNFLARKVIVIQRTLSEEQIREKFGAELRHIVRNAEFEALDNKQLEKRYDLNTFKQTYGRLPTREEMIRAICHQEAYRFIDNVVGEVHNYYLVVEDDVTFANEHWEMLTNLVTHYIATRLDTRTELIELSNSYWNKALEQVNQDPHQLQGHKEVGDLPEVGQTLLEAKNSYGYGFPEYALSHDHFKDYYVLGSKEQNYAVNPFLDIQITSNHARTGAKAYLIFSYPIKTQTVAYKPISWLHDDFPRILFYHNLALAYAMPPIYF